MAGVASRLQPTGRVKVARPRVSVRAGSGGGGGDSGKGVLFVCLGNICRSPTAEAVFRSKVESCSEARGIRVESCGTGGGSRDWYKSGGWSYHEGESADQRMAAAAAKRGIHMTSTSRPLNPQDFHVFTHIVCMDKSNKDSCLTALSHWREIGIALPRDAEKRLSFMMDYADATAPTEVPDPYYGGPQGFEKVLDLLDEPCSRLLESVLNM